MVDGLDGAGKGVFLNTVIEEMEKSGQQIFDVHKLWEKHNRLPYFKELEGHQVISTSEPTYYGPGKFLRQTLISKNAETKYSTWAIAQCYALDRQVLYEGLVLPCLEKGVHVIQSRSVSTSLIYQKLTGQKDGVSLEDILNLPGNQFALEHAPDYLVILTLRARQIIERLEKRGKKDDAIFENLEFQRKVRREFESEWFREFFESRGTKVVYLDFGKSIEESANQTRDFFNKYLKKDLLDR